MKNTDNQYLWDELNNKFDRDLDALKERYDRDVELLAMADARGLNMMKKWNLLWVWFDRKTGYRFLPKILVFVIILSVSLSVAVHMAMLLWKIEYIGSIDLGVVVLLSYLIIPGMIVCFAGLIANRHVTNNMGNDIWNKYPTVTDPAWHDLEENIYHRSEQG